ncbi:MAG: sulfatase-like hydrolase/transferase [Chitinophagales bacterium]
MKKLSLLILFICLFVFLFQKNSIAQNNQRPNILFIVIDDGRYQDYASTGGPSWFLTPTINRIADEGADFKKDYVVLSLCEPSRVSIFTGQYPHHNGFTTNIQTYDTSTLTIARILRNNGYYTGLVGKFLNEYIAFPDADFNYYCAYSGFGNYGPKIFNLNGMDTLLNENVQIAINDYALHFLQSVPDSLPFFLIYSTKAPHPAYSAYPGFENAFHAEPVAFPENFDGYTKNYPNYIYLANDYGIDSVACVSDIQTYYETLIGVEAGLDSVFTVLESKGILDSTLIVYTSDNGVFIGEHYMQRKRLAYEESIHVPLFVRYPKWFPAHTIVDDEFSLNIDFFKTFLDAAGITDTFNDDGISLRDLANQTQHRNIFMYEYFKDTSQPGIPDFRSIRSMRYKYIRSYCDQFTEEFYDLLNDPHEDTNQIFNPAYSSLISEYQFKLDSMRLALGDSSVASITSCSLLNIDTLFSTGSVLTESKFSFQIFPDPATDFLSLQFDQYFTEQADVLIGDVTGKTFWKKKFSLADFSLSNTISIDVSNLPPGIYVLKFSRGKEMQVKLFVKK